MYLCKLLTFWKRCSTIVYSMSITSFLSVAAGRDPFFEHSRKKTVFNALIWIGVEICLPSLIVQTGRLLQLVGLLEFSSFILLGFSQTCVLHFSHQNTALCLRTQPSTIVSPKELFTAAMFTACFFVPLTFLLNSSSFSWVREKKFSENCFLVLFFFQHI